MFEYRDFIEYFIWSYGIEIIGLILASIFGCLGYAAKKIYQNHINDGTKRSIAKAVVQFVEQVYKDIHGEEKLFGIKQIWDGQRCLLRSEIVRIYHEHKEARALSEDEYLHLEFCYKAYKALGGNSFIDHIYAEMQEWDII